MGYRVGELFRRYEGFWVSVQANVYHDAKEEIRRLGGLSVKEVAMVLAHNAAFYASSELDRHLKNMKGGGGMPCGGKKKKKGKGR